MQSHIGIRKEDKIMGVSETRPWKRKQQVMSPPPPIKETMPRRQASFWGDGGRVEVGRVLSRSDGKVEDGQEGSMSGGGELWSSFL